MHTFKTQKNLFLKNTIIHWASWLALILAGWLINQQFELIRNSIFFSGFGFWLFYMLVDVIRGEQHVEEIQVYPQTKTFTIVLNSLLSGKKQMTFSLDQVSSDFEIKNKWFSSAKSGILSIYIPDKKYFKITGRYGFSFETLSNIHHLLNTEPEYVASIHNVDGGVRG